ncbi:MAG: 4Fe-4S binding protein [Lachnospiraceae bacterium]|nr:4Fe-4S binding protein [Lachnospiraceae bacterium]
MIRRIIKIDENKCNGCGECVKACHEGAIEMKEGKARLVCEDYCDGLGDCLPKCPCGAITFEEREAPAYDAEAVAASRSRLGQWPCQLRLVPVNAPYFDGAKLLVAADCTAYAYAAIHRDYMDGRVTLIGCPKLDPVDYSEKLTEILKHNNIENVTVLRMEVPCCKGLETAVKRALENSQKCIPQQVAAVSINGKILERERS